MNAVISVAVTIFGLFVAIKCLLAWLSRPTVHVHNNNYSAEPQPSQPAPVICPVYVPVPIYPIPTPTPAENTESEIENELHGMIDGYYGDRRAKTDD